MTITHLCNIVSKGYKILIIHLPSFMFENGGTILGELFLYIGNIGNLLPNP
ncbi:hypothetical protein YWY31_17090 [Paenibacillus illinoisensis]